MADLKYYDVILRPVVTEKSMNAMADKKYTFMVHPDANKAQIKEAVEKMFDGTKVEKEMDFAEVRGDFDSNAFVQAVLEHIRVKQALGDELIARLERK